MQSIVDTDPRKDVFAIMWLATFLSFFFSIYDIQPMGSPIMGITIYLLIAAVLSVIGAAMIYFIIAPITRWTGSWLGGTANTMLVRSALAWSMIPKIWIGFPFLLVFFYLMLQSSNNTQLGLYQEHQYLAVLFIPLIIVMIWAFFTYLKCLAQVNNFSAWMAFANSIIAGIVLFIIFLLLFFAIGLALFSFSGDFKNKTESLFNNPGFNLNQFNQQFDQQFNQMSQPNFERLQNNPLTQSNQASTRSTCLLQNLAYSNDAVVYGVGIEGGRNTGFAIDPSGREAMQFDLDINSKSSPVILMLTNSEPTIWNLRWTEKTQIEAIMVSGKYKQAVAGIKSNVPVIIQDDYQTNQCGGFNTSLENIDMLNQTSQKLFAKKVNKFFLGDATGVVNVGAPLSINDQILTSLRVTPESFQTQP